MDTEVQQKLHVYFFPLFAPGHMIPLIDMARLFAARGVKVTIITTPLNVHRFQTTIDRDIQSGLHIELHILQFPCSDAGLPEGSENADDLPSRDLTLNFSKAITMLQPQFEKLVQNHLPDAIISDLNLPWTAEIARKYEIPRIVFNNTCCFSISVAQSVNRYMPHANIMSDSEPFLVPGLPDPVHVTKAQLPERSLGKMGLREFFQKVREADRTTSATVVNSFYELEPDYVQHYQKITGKKVWTLGPLSLTNIDSLDKAERGNESSIDRDWCLEWLDSKKPKSVLYVCFGSLCRFVDSQLLEIGLGLEASNHSFIWVIRDVDSGLAEGFEERVQGRGLIIRGWAPQVLILDHPAVGGFMTHCGWNSVVEAFSASVPLITWPLFADQFYIERFVLQLLRIGIGIGVESVLEWGEEERIGALVKREQVEEAVTRLMGGGCGGEEVERTRKRASQLGEMARLAVGEGGSSYLNMSLLIDDLMSQKRERLARDKRSFPVET